MKANFYLFIGFILISSLKLQSQVSGTVFRDFNGNGTQQTSTTFNEVGVEELLFTFLTVRIPASTTTLQDGTYSFPNSGVTTAGQKLRRIFRYGQVNFLALLVIFCSVHNCRNIKCNFGLNYP
ncbi:MAG: hypothetical protein IPG00_15170 [Saprospiraceae bacterium]|nr:hypothetical protein [Saprospiraceae bacterium]